MPTVSIESIEDVGLRTAALSLEAPDEFDAFPGQFVLVRANISGEEKTGYYTISSPNVEGTFEITVAADPDGTLGPWLADREPGQTITIDGPFGDVKYAGEGDAVVLASGPGIGPAVGIGERALASGQDVAIVYRGDQPPQKERLDALASGGATVTIVDELESATEQLRSVSDEHIFVFGFEEFVRDAQEVLSASGIDVDEAEIESFGPE